MESEQTRLKAEIETLKKEIQRLESEIHNAFDKFAEALTAARMPPPNNISYPVPALLPLALPPLGDS